MMKRNAEEVLEYMISVLLLYLEELSAEKSDNPFLYGERIAYTECLECIQKWEGAERNGLNFDIEKRYPL